MTDVVCPEYPTAVRTLPEVLAWQASVAPDRVVCHRIRRQREGIAVEAMTVAQLLASAGRAAAHLRAAGVERGERVLLSLADPHDFLITFVGTQLAGGCPVPLPTASESTAPRSFAQRIHGVHGDCAPRAAVVDDAPRFRETVGTLDAATSVHDVRALGADTSPLPWGGVEADAPAFIQYTSGSTGRPKGVVVTQENLLANCRAIRDATGYTRADRMVAWLPLHHDMGLVGGLLTSIYCAAETFLMTPLAFLARPVTWLQAITHCRATLTVGPTFAYSLCARKIPDKQLVGLDLSSLRLAYVGAEPIDPTTVRQFQERFRAYGFSDTAMYPVYGLAEATLAVSFPPPGRSMRTDTIDRGVLASDGLARPLSEGASAMTLVSVGQPLPRHEVTIVSPVSGAPLPERQVGELVVRGPSVAARYFGEPPSAARSVLHTGDLAYVADGEIYIVDRLKDLIIIGGQNYVPSDIEQAIADIPGLRRGRIVAFAAPGPLGTEALHVVAEASPTAWEDPATLGTAVQRRVRETVGLGVESVTIVPAGTLERTSSGKIKRRACMEAHRCGTLPALRTRADVAMRRVAYERDALVMGATHAARRMWDWLGDQLGRPGSGSGSGSGSGEE